VIADAEIRRAARRASVEPGVIELDYAIGWALWGLAQTNGIGDRLLFKGGTCLRKCYIPHYRFSEDLDFTALRWFDWEEFRQGIAAAMARAAEESGINFGARELYFDVVNNDYGKETLHVRIYWHGPHSQKGSPRTVRVDISRGEEVMFEPVRRKIWHPYSDAADMGAPTTWACYALEEVMAEKLRAVLGQRQYAVSRDLYDIYSLLEEGVDENRVREVLPTKLRAKDLSIEVVTAERLVQRRAEFQADWDRNLVHLIPRDRLPGFEAVWERAYEYARTNLHERS
jgi:predicted nucleotidyltransferase component of viral defense system